MKSPAVRRPSNVPSNTVFQFSNNQYKSSERGVIKRGVRNAQIFLRFSNFLLVLEERKMDPSSVTFQFFFFQNQFLLALSSETLQHSSTNNQLYKSI